MSSVSRKVPLRPLDAGRGTHGRSFLFVTKTLYHPPAEQGLRRGGCRFWVSSVYFCQTEADAQRELMCVAQAQRLKNHTDSLIKLLFIFYHITT